MKHALIKDAADLALEYLRGLRDKRDVAEDREREQAKTQARAGDGPAALAESLYDELFHELQVRPKSLQ